MRFNHIDSILHEAHLGINLIKALIYLLLVCVESTAERSDTFVQGKHEFEHLLLVRAARRLLLNSDRLRYRHLLQILFEFLVDEILRRSHGLLGSLRNGNANEWQTGGR